jgi:hypothetical protein
VNVELSPCALPIIAGRCTSWVENGECTAAKKSRSRQKVFPKISGPRTCDAAARSCACSLSLATADDGWDEKRMFKRILFRSTG